MLRAALALTLLSLVMLIFMYATRLPAMSRAKIAPQMALHPRTVLDKLPSEVRQVADNFNHLFEAPTMFFAAVFAIVLLGAADAVHANLAWAYVAARVAHSAVQSTVNIVALRFLLYITSWAFLGAMIVRALVQTS